MALTPKATIGLRDLPKVYPYAIDYSALMGNDYSAPSYLRMNDVTPENVKKFTVSFWLKHPGVDPSGYGCYGFGYGDPTKSDVTNAYAFFGIIGITNYGMQIGARKSDNTTMFIARVGTPEMFVSDPTNWKHYVITVDSTQSALNDRVRVWMNGVRVTSLSWHTPMAQNADVVLGMYASKPILIGCGTRSGGAGEDYSFCNTRFAEYHMVTGSALEADDFGMWSAAVSGLWVGREYKGGHGTNGFYLPFDDAADIGKDASGNDNNCVTVGSPVQAVDTPTNNHCTLNPLNANAIATTYSNGSLTFSAAGARVKGVSTFGFSSGKWYCETEYASSNQAIFGIGSSEDVLDDGYFLGQSGNDGYGLYMSDGTVYNNGGTTATGLSLAAGIPIRVAVDADAGKLWYGDATSWFGDPVAGTGGINIEQGKTWFFCASYDGEQTVNFGDTGFAYTPPEGFEPLCTANLPEPTIVNPATGNDVVLYDGTGSGKELCVGGIVTDSGSQSGRTGAKAFDNASGTNRAWQSPNVFPSGEAWVAYELPSPAVVTRYSVTSGVSAYTRSHDPKSWSLAGFNGESWDVLHTVANAPAWAASETRTYEFANSTEYQKYRWMFTDTQGHANLVIDELELYSGPPNTIGGLLFKPDYVKTKRRNTTGSWSSFDSLRGPEKLLLGESAAAESDYLDSLISFNADGFSLGANSGTNSNYEYLAHCLKRGPEFGFDIVTYTGDGVAGKQIAHNCGGVPEMIVVKSLDSVTSWEVYHTALGATKFLNLNSPEAAQTNVIIWNNTEPTATHFTVGTSIAVNGSGKRHIAYVFRSVPGFSKVFSYAGNNSADGPFVNLGFRPKAIMGKDSEASENWFFLDSERDPHNRVTTVLYPDLPNSEAPTATSVNFCSNGFKPVTAGITNNVAGNTVIGIAWADQPFKYSNAF